MFTKVRHYTTQLSAKDIKAKLNNHSDPFYKFSLSNRYETNADDHSFTIKSMPASRRGIYREKHFGEIISEQGQTKVVLTSKLNKVGPIVVALLFVLFMSSTLVVVFGNENGLEKALDRNMIGMIIFMLVFHVMFYLIFIQLFSRMARKWIEKKLKLEPIKY